MTKSAYTVGQVNRYISNMFQEDFLLSNIHVKGEVSNCKYHSSGHIYFTIKDRYGALSCVMFAGKRSSGLKFPMKDGDNVIVQGSVGVYEKAGSYQLYANSISLEGAGDLYQRFEELKKSLEEMGMFSAEYKKPVPKFAQTIGIVTAPTGAAVRDIIQISKRRNPYAKLILYPALVQGEGAAASIVNGIHALDAMHPDVIIVGRGGGSIEDLWAFNEEAVARAIFACETPVISAVGHETDTTIADFVSDLRAPTPSAAAELAVFDYSALMQSMDQLARKMAGQLDYRIRQERERHRAMFHRLQMASPEAKLTQKRQQSMQMEDLLSMYMSSALERSRHRLAVLSGRLDGLSPVKRLADGYSYLTDQQGRNLTSHDQVSVGDSIHIYMKQGQLDAEITKILES